MRPVPSAPLVQKFVLHFQNTHKGVILSRTLAQQIAEATGSDDADLWIGKRITIFPQPMTVAGKKRVAIRVKPPINGGDSDPPDSFQDNEDILSSSAGSCRRFFSFYLLTN